MLALLTTVWRRLHALLVHHGLRAWNGAVHAWRQGSLRLVRYTVERLMQQRCAQVASSLTFTSLLSLVPLLSIVLSMLALFHVVDGDGAALQTQILNNLTPDAASTRQVLIGYLTEFTHNTHQLTSLGLISLTVTSLLTLTTIDNVFNRLWGVARPRPWAQRFVLYWAILTVGPVVMGMGAYISSALVGGAIGWTMAPPWATHTMLSVSAAGLNILGFTGLYQIVPNRRVKPLHALIGGALAGLAFEVMKRGFSVYAMHVPTYTVLYGAMAVLPVFLLWVYLSWWVILIGAALTSVLPDLKGRRYDQPGAGRAWPVTLGLLLALRDAQGEGLGRSLDVIAPQVGIGFAETEEWLETLLERGWVVRTPEGRWHLALDPRNLRLRTVYDTVVLAPSNDIVGITAGANGLLDQTLFDLRTGTQHGVFEDNEPPSSVNSPPDGL